jgi:hypothetical protein
MTESNGNLHTDPMTTTSPSIHPAVRIIIGVCVAAAAGFGALVAWLFGLFTYTGCFISCTEPNRLAGTALIALAAGLFGVFVAGVSYAIVGQRQIVRIWLIGTAAGAILGIASLVFS